MNRDNFLNAIDFLEQLEPERFNFEIVREQTECGTVACVLGWTPEIFGDSAHAYCIGHPVHASDLYGVDPGIALRLFYPSHTRYAVWNTPENAPGNKATPKEVAESLRRFLAWHDKQEDAK